MAEIASIIEALRNDLAKSSQIVYWKKIPEQKAQFDRLAKPLPLPLEEVLNGRSINLYKHQVAAINQIREGKDVITATPSSSGKSLAFNLPVLESMVDDPFACALYLYPLKALANDQLKDLLSWEKELKSHFRPAIYDGDTPSGAKHRILEKSRLILTNPYALHEYLQWHHQWRRIFSHLKFVVIDEAHTYRGVFGSNFSALIRRLQRILAYYNSSPQFILASATLNNPTDFAKQLIGREFSSIEEDYSPHGARHFLLLNQKADENRSTHLEVRDLVLYLANYGLQVLCFTGSRHLSELLARWTRQQATKFGLDASSIASYRAGYLPEERRDLERGLREGELKILFSTNALELGIDIGSLDAVVMAGYPGTMISTWQQAGRAGRGSQEALVILVCYPNPLDQYFANHPESFFGRPLENALLNPENPYILRGHLLCAQEELPLEEGEVEKFFGSAALPILKEIEEGERAFGGALRTGKRASEIISLNNITSQRVTLLVQGEVLEILDYTQAIRETYPGAIYLHQGESYRIEELDLNHGLAHLIPIDTDIYTQAHKDSRVEVKVIKEKRVTEEGLEVFLGDLKVSEEVSGYYLKKFDRVLDYKELPPLSFSFSTEGVWFPIREGVKEKGDAENWDFDGGIHALEHSLIALTPIVTLSDRWDLGGVSYPFFPALEGPAIFIYDAYPGGVGISRAVFHDLSSLLKMTLEHLHTCPCEEGCPSCVLSPKCGNNNQPISKIGAIRILEELLGK